ncbi:YdgA family protein [Rheinheimera muenzenbergensis]|uniref:YdgA family protein n=1 Tax=Rheinheimera muenzenbergensis TaxID=1193628 RepID=A0ABU8C9Z9_9GAMM
MKKSLIALVVIGVAAAGVVYVNQQAEDAIKQQLDNANQSYRELAASGEMPEISLAYKDVSANVLLSNYSISGLEISLAEMGTIATVDLIQAKGIKPQSLADKGSVKVTGIKAASAVLQMLPPQTSAFMQDIALHGDYDYAYTENGELMFSQQTRINDEFALNYSFSLAQMQQFWQVAKDLSALPPELLQALLTDEAYIGQMIEKLAAGALKNGNITIENKGFIERTLAMTAEMGQTPDYRTVQGMALAGVGSAPQLPQDMKDTLTAFVQKPEKLSLSFGFTEPLQFARMQSGELAEHMVSPEAMIKFANVKLQAN